MQYITRCRPVQRLKADQGKWISYQLRLRNITQYDLAKLAGCSQPTVANTLAGRTSSTKVYTVLCDLLGYDIIGEMLNGSSRSVA